MYLEKNRDREALVDSYFRQLGCDELEQQPVSSKAGNNLVCLVRGISDDEILVGAHYDKLGMSSGVADNWTGIVALLALAERAIKNQPVHTMRFVAFAGEELGLHGSKAYIGHLEEARKPLPGSMINLDTLGISTLTVDRRSHPELVCLAQAAADNVDMGLPVVLLRDISSDWAPFKRAGVNVLSFHSVTRSNRYDLHTHRDQRALVDDGVLQQSYKVIANTLDALDHGMDTLLMQDPG